MIEGVFVHAAAIVETEQIGAGTRIWAFAHIMKGVSIGENCNVGDHCFIESGAKIGNDVTVKNGNMIWEGVTLEDGVFIGPHVFFTNDVYPRSGRLPEARERYSDRRWLRPTLVRTGASLGAGAAVLAGLTLNEFCMVGAGAVVTKDIPAYALVVGNPARVRGWVCRCGLPLAFRRRRAVCAGCGLAYVRDMDTIRPV
jgi:acetyltransferase-like isoleucine patch superfamily enzyme